MKVSEYLKEESCVMNLQATTKVDAIKEIALLLSENRKVSNLQGFVKDVLEREELGSTGIGHAIAIPHARTNAVSGFVIGFGKSKSGIEFASIDNQKVNIIFLMGADPKELNLYLRLLAELSKLLMNSSFRSALLNAETPKDIINAIKQYERPS